MLLYLRFLLKTIKIMLIFIPRLLKKLTSKINKGLRFSISFKMTAVYTMFFSSTLFIFSVGLIIGFRVFLLNQVQSELTRYSLVAINYAKLNKDISDFDVNIFSKIENVTFSVFDKSETLVYSTQKDKTKVAFNKDTSTYPVINETNQPLVFVTTNLIQDNKTFFLQFYHRQSRSKPTCLFL